MSRTIFQRAKDRLSRLSPDVPGFDLTSLSVPQRTRFHSYFQAAWQRLDGATQLGESDNTIPALLLYQSGFELLARAHGVVKESKTESVGNDPASTREHFIGFVASKYDRAARVLRDSLSETSDDVNAPDVLPERELRARVDELSAVTPDVLALMAPRTADLKWRRAVRNGVVVAGLLISLGAIVADVVRPENIALHKAARSASTAFNTQPSGAVNGKIYEQYGFHSDTEPSPWLRIDLGRRYKISRIRVFGRHDCCFDQSIPMAVEVSDDGENFTTVEERHQAFDQLDPWEIVPDGPVQGRFVRARTLKKGLLVLTEVEVYGKPTH